MTKSILIVAPVSFPGQPVTERVNSFVEFFQSRGIAYVLYPAPQSVPELLRLIAVIYRQKWRNIFLTLPPFRNWSLCLLPGVNVILDIRDGWSIAMRSGYGGITKPRKLKSMLARVIEQVAIRLSALTITCTPGLMEYHATRLNKKNMVLITNGVPSREYEYILSLRENRKESPSDRLRFICAGKFSVYGRDRAERILEKIAKDFPQREIVIDIYSGLPSENDWIGKFIDERNLPLKVKNNNSIGRNEILKEISRSEFGLTLVRDSSYEFGTKVFDYVVCGTLLYSGEDEVEGAFKEYFGGYFHKKCEKGDIKRFLRRNIILEKEDEIIRKII